MTTSGAEVYVVKRATPNTKTHMRLLAQERWIRGHADSPGIVNLVDVDVPDGYAMELLCTWGSEWRWPENIISVLERDVWSRKITTTPDIQQCQSYVTNLFYGDELWKWLSQCPITTDWFCDTHGDPTLDNLMKRGDEPVLVDPLPDTTWSGLLPSVRALDLGKIMQSVIGYERVKSGDLHWELRGSMTDPLTVVRDHCVSLEEWELTKCFTAIHIARLIPYQEPVQAAFWRRSLPDIISRLREI